MSTTLTSTIGDRVDSSVTYLARPREIFDAASGCHLVLGTPESLPDLWVRYLDGARAVYDSHGVSAALDHDAVLDGSGTALFFVAVDAAGEIRGGHRAQGPYVDVGETHALVEWDGQPGCGDLVSAIEARLPYGVVEMKTAWVDAGAPDPSAVSALLARVAIPTMIATGARFIMATAAEHVLRRWATSGGRVDKGVAASPYPDDRYRTSLMWWDRYTMEALSEPTVWQRISAEASMWTAFDESADHRSVA